jgi:hypothetical protein
MSNLMHQSSRNSLQMSDRRASVGVFRCEQCRFSKRDETPIFHAIKTEIRNCNHVDLWQLELDVKVLLEELERFDGEIEGEAVGEIVMI